MTNRVIVVVVTCFAEDLRQLAELEVLGLTGKGWSTSFAYNAWMRTTEYASQIALILFIIWRSGDPLSRFGIKPFKIGRDFCGGILIWLVMQLSYLLLWWILRIALGSDNYYELVHSGGRGNYYPPENAIQYMVLAGTSVFSGFFQELLMRAYLIVRFEELFDSTWLAFFLSTLLFIFYHGYQGRAGVISVSLFAVIQGILFCIFRRLTPVAISHSIQDFTAIAGFRFF